MAQEIKLRFPYLFHHCRQIVPLLFGDFSQLSTIKLKFISIAIAPFSDLNDKAIIFIYKEILSIMN